MNGDATNGTGIWLVMGFVSVAAEPAPQTEGTGNPSDMGPGVRIEDAGAWANPAQPLRFAVVAGNDGVAWGAPLSDIAGDRERGIFNLYVEAEAKWIDGFLGACEAGAWDDPDEWMD